MYRSDLEGHYEKEKTQLEKFLNSFVSAKSQLNLKDIIAAFGEQKPSPSISLIEHLNKLEKKFNEKDDLFYR